MKVAILISGFLRTIEHNLEKNLKLFKNAQKEDENNRLTTIDYYLHISNYEHMDEYYNKNTSIKKIINKLKPIHVIYENEINTTGIDTKYVNMYRMWYKIYLLNSLKTIYEQTHDFTYDLVIRIRPDLYILDNLIDFEEIITINKKEKERKHMIQTKQVYALNDELFMSDSITMNNICNLFNDFKTLIKIINSNRKYHDNYKKTMFFELHCNKQNINIVQHRINYKLILSLCNIIAISGDSGTGKTTLMKHVNSLFKVDPLQIEGDRYHKWERGHENWNKFTHLDPQANHISKFTDDVFNLKIGNDIYQVDYDHCHGKFTSVQELKNKDNIILCGLHTLFDKETNKLYNLKIFLEPDERLRWYWKIKRDVEKRGYTAEKVLDSIQKRLGDGEKYIKPQSFESDVIISFFTNDDFDYTNLDDNNKPNIYLNIKVNYSIKITNFIGLLAHYDIKTQVIMNTFKNNSCNHTYTQLIFKKISPKFQELYLHLLLQTNKNVSVKKEMVDYYTLIKALFIYLKY
jgi:uridine kinase